jgi:hypothetical protein
VTPAATAAANAMWPWLTEKPAKSMIASLGTGMQALSSVISPNTPGMPNVAITCVQNATSELTMELTPRLTPCDPLNSLPHRIAAPR